MTDVTVISQRLGPIAEAGKNMTKLQTLVKDKSIPRKNVSQTMAGLLKRSGSKKEVEQEENVPEPATEKDDGDEEGDSLGILTKEQATDQEAQTANEAELAAAAVTPVAESTEITDSSGTPATRSDDPAPTAPSIDPSHEPANPFEAPITETGGPSPTIPQKDTVPEIKELELAEEDEPTVTETLAAPPVEEKELPVQPVSPMDTQIASTADNDKVEEELPPALPIKDAKSDNPDGGVDVKIKEESPEVPTKTE